MRQHEYSRSKIDAALDSLQDMLTCAGAIERNTKARNTFSGKKAYSRKGGSFEEGNQYLRQRIYKRLDFMDMELKGKSMDN